MVANSVNASLIDETLMRFESALFSTSIACAAVPFRRHDERGWYIGQTANGKTLAHQISTTLPFDISPEYEDRLNGFVVALEQLMPTVSAMPPSVDGATYYGCGGFVLRFVRVADGLRVDVVVA